MSKSENSWFVPVALAVAVAIALLFFWPRLNPPDSEPAMIEPAPAEDARRRPGPLHPLEPLGSASEGERELVPLPPLDDSDGYFRLELIDLLGNKLDALLTNEALIEKFVATIDNLPRSRVAERIRPVGRIDGSFLVDGDPESDGYVLAEENFGRYDFLVDMITFASVDSIVDAYRRFYPLLQQAYNGLGYPDAYFNDRVVEVIDHLISTPEPQGPLRLVRPHVLYEFADPELEALSSGQKLLLRMGPDNAARIKRRLAELRGRITAGE